jgi:ATP-binding cassette, subfamily F, member 3
MINLENLGVYLPQGYLFEGITLQINRKDRIGLVGKNGAGKSTLMRLIAGENAPSEGKVHRPKDCSIGFLTQDIEINTALSVFDYVYTSNQNLVKIQKRIEEVNDQLVQRSDYESEAYLDLLNELNTLNHDFSLIEGYQWSEKVVSTLKGLGFNDLELESSLNTFSGGWKMRAELAKLLVNNPDALLLDEPTNHLDIISIAWLENYLKSFSGSVIVISHDRLFLDNVTNRTLEITKGKILDFAFHYSKYKEVRAEEIERLASAKKQQDKDIKHAEELIDKFRAKKNKAAFAQSLIKKLDKTERIELEDDSIRGLNISFPLSVQPGKWVMDLKHVGKSYGEKLLFKDVSLTVGRGEKIALLGANGMGKSTLIKCITNEIEFEGEIELGHNVTIGYFAQDQAERLDKTKSVYESVDEIANGDMRKNLRGILGAFLFKGEDVEKKVGVLSGGERTRLALCRMLLSPSNVLVLDEPTNHLDLQSKAILRDALQKYEGTFIVVSHDREFVDGLSNRIWDIDQHQLKVNHFGLKEYLDRKLAELDTKKADLRTEKVQKADAPTSAEDRNQHKELKRTINRLENQIQKSEKRIEEMESEVKSWDLRLAELDYSNIEESDKVLQAYDALKIQLEQEMKKWEELTEELLSLGS